MVTQRVDHIHNGVVQTSVVCLQDQLEDLVDVLLGCHLPLARGEIRKSLGSQDSQPVQLRAVENPVVELRISRALEVDPLTQMIVALLQEDDSVVMLATTTNGTAMTNRMA